MIFSIPIVVVLAISFCVFYFSGEFTPIKDVAKMMSQENVVFGTAYSNFQDKLKMLMIGQNKYDIVAFGTSRILELRAEFFKKPAVFYNAGGAVSRPEGFEYLLKKIPSGNEPKIIILSVDQYFFNSEIIKTVAWVKPEFRDSPFQIFIKGAWKQPFYDYFWGKFSLFSLINHKNLIGLSATAVNMGCRSDGSYYYANFIFDEKMRRSGQQGIENVISSLRSDSAFEYGRENFQPTFDILDNFLKQAKERGIFVVGFLPPYPASLYQAILRTADNDHLSTIKSLPIRLKSLFEEKGFDFYNFTDIKSFGGLDEEMIDCCHILEKGELKLFIEMAQKSPMLLKYVDLKFLKSELNSAKSEFEVFPTKF